MPLRNQSFSAFLLATIFFASGPNGMAREVASWSIKSPLLNQRNSYECPTEVNDGPFLLEARLTLHKTNGSAAAILFGNQLTFGFDGRNGALFAEGPAVKKLLTLAPTKKHLRAGKAFDFEAKRDDSGTLTLSIDGKEVFTKEKFPGALGTITIRPQRNTVDIHALRLSGAIEVPKPGLTLSRTTIPILADGEAHPILNFDLVLTQARTLTGVALDLTGTTRHADIEELLLETIGKTPFGTLGRIGPEVSLTGRLRLPAGRHQFRLLATVKKGSDPLHQIAATCTKMTFGDESKLLPHPADLAPLRLAYPIHKRGQFNCHTFRIPAIARANDGSLLAVYDLRYNSRRDLQEHMDIGLSRSTDGGITWADPVPIMDMGEFGGKSQKENGCSDPGIIVDTKTGEIIVSAVWTHGKPNTHQWSGKGSEPGHDIHSSAQFMVVRSKDHGLTWSPPENLTKALKDPSWYLFAPAPGNGITMRDGTLILPTQGRDATGHPFSNLTWSKDHGKTWTVSKPARDNTTECAVAELSDGSLLLNMRDNRNRGDKSDRNGRALGQTTDLGETWTKHPADHGLLPEPTCMASMISHPLADGRHLLLFSNPRNKNGRRDMTIQLSFDDGKTWPSKHHLLLDEKGGAYSSLVMVDDQTVGILYESSQADMVFQRIALRELIK